MEKSVIHAKGKQAKKLSQITITRLSDGVEIKLRDIERTSSSPEASHLAGKGDALDYFFRYGTPETLQEYHRNASGNTLPEEELSQATSAIVAALANRPGIVKLLRLSGAEPPLQTAVSLGLTTCTEHLLGLHYPVDELLKGEETLLHIAVANQNMEITQQLLNRYANPNILRSSDGLSPFHLAVKQGYVSLAEQLAPYTNQSVKTATGEHVSRLIPQLPRVRSHDQEALRKLVQVDNPDAPENFGQFIADIKAGRIHQVLNYIKQGVDFNVHWNGMTPLHIAVQEGNPDMVKTLLTYIPHGNDGTEGSRLSLILNGFTEGTLEAPLHLAVKGVTDNKEKAKSFLEIIKILLEKGVKVDIPRASDGSTPLLLAAKGGSLDAVSVLKTAVGVDISRPRTNDNATPLHAAVESGNLKLVISLLRAGANATALMIQGDEKLYPLDIALKKNNPELVNTVARQSWFLFDFCKTGEVEEVRRYLEAGVPATLERQGAYSLLHQAVRSGSHEMIDLLIKNGADVNKAYQDGNTPLHIAAEYASLGAMTALAHHNAEFRKNKAGKTPLDLALLNHHGQVARHLSGHYFPITPASPTGPWPAPHQPHPLIEAVINGDINFITMMKNESAMPSEMPTDKDGNTPLHLAAMHKQVKVIPLLMDLKLNDTLNKKLQTPLHIALSTEHEETIKAFQPLMNPSLFWAIRSDKLFFVEMILNTGVKFNPEDKETGDYPLHVAARTGQSGSVRILLKQNPPFSRTDSKNNHGKTPVDEALDPLDRQDETLNKKEFRTIVVQLLEAEGGSSFFQAVRDSKQGLIERLLRADVDINMVDQWGESALHKAAKRGLADMVRFLKEHGADTALRNRNGHTACQLARQGRHRDTVRLLDDGGFCTLF